MISIFGKQKGDFVVMDGSWLGTKAAIMFGGMTKTDGHAGTYS